MLIYLIDIENATSMVIKEAIPTLFKFSGISVVLEVSMFNKP